MTLQLTKKHNFDTVFDSQKVFRLILEAMSNPGKNVDIKECAEKLYGDNSVFLAIAMTLLDNEVSFHVCGDTSSSLSDEIASLTHAAITPIESADFIFAMTPISVECAIENAKCGTLADPHKSATVIIRNEGDLYGRILLQGPGIQGSRGIWVTQTVKDALTVHNAQHYEYPQGIDLLFVSTAGNLFAVPRTVKSSAKCTM